MTKSQSYWLLGLCLITTVGFSDPTSVSQTKQQLSALQIKINKLQQTLKLAHDKRQILNTELLQTEKKMAQSNQQLQTIKMHLLASEKKASIINEQILIINRDLEHEKTKLFEHLRIRYKTGQAYPLKWLINQENPNGLQRVMIYHEYMLKQRKVIIANMQTLQQKLHGKEAQLQQEIETEQHLQQALHQHQLSLEENKQYHKTLIQTLQKDIDGKQQTLAEYQQNQRNLARILDTLIQEQRKRPSFFPSFHTNSNHKLAMPVLVNKNNIEKINQGIVLFANEGAPVMAASAGRVVFNDWLKGYGLLLIVDHGQGLMTLYAHNQSVLKKKGDTVMRGEKIALVGHSGTIRQNGLYFEVRRRGKAVSPLAWLA